MGGVLCRNHTAGGGFLAINAANTDKIREPTKRMDNSYTSYHNMFKDNLNIDMIY